MARVLRSRNCRPVDARPVGTGAAAGSTFFAFAPASSTAVQLFIWRPLGTRSLQSSWEAVAQSTSGGGGEFALDVLSECGNLEVPETVRCSLAKSTCFIEDAWVGDEYALGRGFLGAGIVAVGLRRDTKVSRLEVCHHSEL